MRLGLHPMDFGGTDDITARLSRLVTTSEEIGLHSVWFMDHLFQIPVVGAPSEPMLEAYTTLAWTAARTSRIHLGALVTAVTYRHPGMLLKSVTTLDVLSGGRAWLGLGAAWNEHEARSLGLPFPPLRTRFEQLADVLELAERMFTDDSSRFQGRRFTLPEPINHPLPLRRPPILIGGGGEKKTLRLVARHADATNLFEPGLPHKLDVLRGHCEAEGRRFEDIAVTTTGLLGPIDSVDRAVERFGSLAEQGVDLAIVDSPEPFDDTAVFLAEVAGQVAHLGRPSPQVLVGAPGGVVLANTAAQA